MSCLCPCHEDIRSARLNWRTQKMVPWAVSWLCLFSVLCWTMCPWQPLFTGAGTHAWPGAQGALNNLQCEAWRAAWSSSAPGAPSRSPWRRGAAWWRPHHSAQPHNPGAYEGSWSWTVGMRAREGISDKGLVVLGAAEPSLTFPPELVSCVVRFPDSLYQELNPYGGQHMNIKNIKNWNFFALICKNHIVLFLGCGLVDSRVQVNWCSSKKTFSWQKMSCWFTDTSDYAEVFQHLVFKQSV